MVQASCAPDNCHKYQHLDPNSQVNEAPLTRLWFYALFCFMFGAQRAAGRSGGQPAKAPSRCLGVHKRARLLVRVPCCCFVCSGGTGLWAAGAAMRFEEIGVAAAAGVVRRTCLDCDGYLTRMA